MPSNMRVLAVDPGFDRLGVAVLEKKGSKEHLLYSHCFETDKKDLFEERLFVVGEELERLFGEFQPEIFASEALYFSKNQKTAMDVAGVRGIIIYIAQKHTIPYREYTPSQIKTAVTGYGKSDKRQVMDMVARLVKIDKNIALDDEYDAIAVGLTCLASER